MFPKLSFVHHLYYYCEAGEDGNARLFLATIAARDGTTTQTENQSLLFYKGQDTKIKIVQKSRTVSPCFFQALFCIKGWLLEKCPQQMSHQARLTSEQQCDGSVGKDLTKSYGRAELLFASLE